MKILQFCPPHLSDVTTLPWEIQRSHFSAVFFIYVRLEYNVVSKLRSKISTKCVARSLCDIPKLFVDAA